MNVLSFCGTLSVCVFASLHDTDVAYRNRKPLSVILCRNMVHLHLTVGEPFLNKCVFSGERVGPVGGRRPSARPGMGGGSGCAGGTAAAGSAHLHHVQGETALHPHRLYV